MQSNKDHAVYSDLFSLKRKCKPEGYHAVCVIILRLHSCKTLRPASPDVIAAEIELSQPNRVPTPPHRPRPRPRPHPRPHPHPTRPRGFRPIRLPDHYISKTRPHARRRQEARSLSSATVPISFLLRSS